MVGARMVKFPCNGDFVELIEAFEEGGKMSRWELKKMTQESIREVLRMIFSNEIAEFIEDSLDLNAQDDEEGFDPAHFVEKLRMVFGKDERHIRMMVMGKMLTKYHYHGFMESIGSPITT